MIPFCCRLDKDITILFVILIIYEIYILAHCIVDLFF